MTELRGIDHEFVREQLTSMLSGLSGVGQAQTILGQADEMVAMLKIASVMSVSVRKAVQPAIRGLRSFRTAFSTAGSWEALADSTD